MGVTVNLRAGTASGGNAAVMILPTTLRTCAVPRPMTTSPATGVSIKYGASAATISCLVTRAMTFCTAAAGDDELNGGDGDDTLEGGYGADELTGGEDDRHRVLCWFHDGRHRAPAFPPDWGR